MLVTCLQDTLSRSCTDTKCFKLCRQVTAPQHLARHTIRILLQWRHLQLICLLLHFQLGLGCPLCLLLLKLLLTALDLLFALLLLPLFELTHLQGSSHAVTSVAHKAHPACNKLGQWQQRIQCQTAHPADRPLPQYTQLIGRFSSASGVVSNELANGQHSACG